MQLYTTPEASKTTGIPEGTIRSWLSRYPEAFQPDIHLAQQEGKKLWTEAGLELLRQRDAENKAKGNAAPETAIDSIAKTDAIAAAEPATNTIASNDATDNATQHAANNNAGETTFSDAMVNAFTDKISVELAATIAERLPSRILFHINRMLQAPSIQEREILQNATTQQLQKLPGVEKKYLALPQSKQQS